MLLIGISGKMHSGKNLAGNYLQSFVGGHQDAFASHLKSLCADALDLPLQLFFNKKEKTVMVNGELITLRQYMQRIGSALRSVDEDVFVRKLFASHKNRQYPLIVTDVRFPNEAKAIQQVGGITVRIERDFELRFDKREIPDVSVLRHESEIELDEYDFDFKIVNNSTKGDLAAKIQELYFTKLKTISL